MSRASRIGVLLAALGSWAAAVPFLAPLEVAMRLEIADHVVPGAALVAIAGLFVGLRPAQGSVAWVAATAAAFLVGVWITTTHLPLVGDVLDGGVPWLAGVLHVTAGWPIAVAGAWLLLSPER